MDNNIGKKLEGRYELLELIGVGGMADIYRARDIQEERIVAVKILKTEFAGSDEFLRRFHNESKAIALLSHPNIVKIYDVGFTDKVQFIVMEYVDGITLTDYIEQQGVLKWRDAIHFTVQVLRALQHAHDRGIVHRDVKSSNIMLLRDGTIKVMDFGIARFNRENNKTMSEKTIGSVHYISPEQARGDITDERSDIYSVGVALYEMLTGRKPFDGDTPVAIALKHMQSAPKRPSEINETIPEGLEQIVLRAMQKDPSARYQTAGEMIGDLDEFKKNPGIVFDYKYNSTDGTAKFIDRPNPAVEKEALRRKRIDPEEEYGEDEDDDDYYDDDDELEERRSPLIPILFAVGAAFVIATVFLLLKLVVDGFGPVTSGISTTVSGGLSYTPDGDFFMPDIVGMKFQDAQAMYPEINFDIKMEWSTEQPKDHIIATTPNQGVRHKITQQVTVRVSKGKKLVEIRDFSGRQQNYAKEQLEKDGFRVKITQAQSETVASGCVISTQPPAHEQAEEGSLINLIISMGSKNSSVVVPKLTDMTISQAQQLCDSTGIIIEPDFVPSEKPQGWVLEQSIPKGDLVDKETTIKLTVSTGVIPDLECLIDNIYLPLGYTGEYELGYFVNGQRDVSKDPDIRDVSISVTRTVSYTVKGKFGEKKEFGLKLKSRATQKEGWFIKFDVDFTGEKPVAIEKEINKFIFEELQSITTSDPYTSSDTTSSEPNSETTSDLAFSNLSDAELQSLVTILRSGGLGYGTTATTSSYGYGSTLSSLLSKLGYGSNTNLSTNERQALLSALRNRGYGY